MQALKVLDKRKINFFIVGYILAFFVLAIVGYKVADTNNRAAVALHRVMQQGYFETDLAMYDLPRINLNLQSNYGKTTRVRIEISLEIAKKDLDRLEGYKPRITDKVIMYMRNQDIESVASPQAMHDLHAGLLRIVDTASQPVPIHDIIFRQFLVL